MILAWHASERFQDYLAQELTKLTAQVREVAGDNLLALILTGGYGRGEGGVVIVDQQEMPYNDLDLVMVVRKHGPDYGSLLAPVSKEWSARLKIHVDFSRPLTVDQVKKLPHKLMWQDILFGHIILYGDADILQKNMPAKLREPIPQVEAIHLLLNRGAGLIWSMRIFEGFAPADEADFIRRNYFKAALALGDALLIAHYRHQTSYRGRDGLLEALSREVDFPGRSELLPLYRRALAFKFSPDAEKAFVPSPLLLESISALFVDIFLCIEAKRTGRKFANAAEYCASDFIREADEHQLIRLPRNLYYNLRQGRISLRYPREILYRLLLDLLTSRPSEPGWDERSLKFLKLWEKFN